MLITGLDIEEKAKIVIDTFFSSVGGKEQFDDVCIELVRLIKRTRNVMKKLSPV